MEKPEIIWKDKNTQSQIIENLSADLLTVDYPVYISTRKKVNHWQTIRELYRYFRDQLQGKCQRKHLLVEYNGGAAPYKMTCYISGCNPEVIWSLDTATQEKAKEKFSNWHEIEDFYNHIRDRFTYRKIKQQEWLAEQEKISQQRAAEAQLKEERHEKWLQNDPNSPAARNQRARRHLMRLGYTLHKSNIIRYYTADDRGQYKIVDASGKAVLGKKFDASIDDVERFYTALDKKRWAWKYQPQKEKIVDQQKKTQEEKAAAQLKKFGFDLEKEEGEYCIVDSLGYTVEYCKSLEKIEKIIEKLKKKGFKEREKPVKQRKILHEFEEKVSSNQDIWVQIGFDWKSTERNKGYMIVDRDKILLGENYSLTLDDIAEYIKKEGREDWQKENAVRYQLRKYGYLLRKKKVRDWNNYDPHEFQIVDAATKEIVAGAETRLTLEEVESWILRDNCLEKST